MSDFQGNLAVNFNPAIFMVCNNTPFYVLANSVEYCGRHHNRNLTRRDSLKSLNNCIDFTIFFYTSFLEESPLTLRQDLIPPARLSVISANNLPSEGLKMHFNLRDKVSSSHLLFQFLEAMEWVIFSDR